VGLVELVGLVGLVELVGLVDRGQWAALAALRQLAEEEVHRAEHCQQHQRDHADAGLPVVVAEISQGGSSYPEQLTWKSLPGVGDQAMKAVISSPELDGGTTLVAVRVGNLVATTLYNDQNTTGSAGVALTERLAKNLG
jgi:hypothetical protein